MKVVLPIFGGCKGTKFYAQAARRRCFHILSCRFIYIS